MDPKETSPDRQLDDLTAPGRSAIGAGALLSVLAAILWTVQAAALAVALGDLLAGDATSTIWCAGTFLLVGLLRALLNLAADQKLQAAAEAVVGSLRHQIVEVEARHVESKFGKAGSIASLATEKLELLAPYLTRFQPARYRVAILPLVILLLTSWYSWAAALILVVSGPLIPLFMGLVGMAAKDASRQQLSDVATLNDLLVARLQGLVDIRLLGAATEMGKQFLHSVRQVRRSTMSVLRIAFLSSAVLELFAALGVAMIAVFVGFSSLGLLEFGTWGVPLSPAAAIFILLLAPDFFQPLRDLAAAWHDKAAAVALAEEYHRWRTAQRISLPGTGQAATPLSGPAHVTLSGSHSPAGDPLPKIAIEAGQSVALVGPSGAGKTSALRMIAGLLDPYPGKLLVAGIPFSTEIADAWRARIGWMPQQPHFLDATLASNVSMGRQGDVRAALEAAGVTDLIRSLPAGIHTKLGESGGGLSGGEARRVMLARAIFAGPDIILADEPTADLDAETAQAVEACLLCEVRRGATLIVATHDRAFARRLGQIVHFGEEQ